MLNNTRLSSARERSEARSASVNIERMLRNNNAQEF